MNNNNNNNENRKRRDPPTSCEPPLRPPKVAQLELENNNGILFAGMNVELSKVILPVVWKHLSLADLKSVRLVCQMWREFALDRWRERGTLIVHQNEPAGDDSELANGIALKELQGILEDKHDVFNLVSKPFQKYKLIKWEVKKGSDDWFWKRCGPSMKTLQLQDCTFEREENRWPVGAEAFTSILLVKTPNLESLVLCGNTWGGEVPSRFPYGGLKYKFNTFRLEEPIDVDSNDESYDEGEGENSDTKRDSSSRGQSTVQRSLTSLKVRGRFPFNWADCFIHYPNLKTIEVKYFEDFNNRIYKLIMQLKSLEDASRFRHLDIMESGYHFRWEDMDLLNDTNLTLESLGFAIAENVYENELGKVLNKFGDALQTLKLLRPPFDTPLDSLQITREFGNLKEIQLFGNVISSFKFLKWTPNLVKLKLNQACYGMEDCMTLQVRKYKRVQFDAKHMITEAASTMENVVLKQLSDFEIDYQFDKDSLLLLASWMPNLKHLRMVLDNQSLFLVYTTWPRLVELSLLCGSDVDDMGITASVPGKKGSRGISCLKYLQSFKLVTTCNLSKLTDISVYQGFSRLPNLNFLSICASPLMTDEAVRHIRDRIPRATIYRNRDVP